MQHNFKWMGCMIALLFSSCHDGKDVDVTFKEDDECVKTHVADVLTRRDLAGYTVYYFDSQDGNDSNDGLSQDTPWKSLTKLYNKDLLREGVAVLLKRGSVFNGALWGLPGSGSQERPIVISDYGEGELPKIAGSNTMTLQLVDNSYWEFFNIHFTSQETEERPNMLGVNLRAVEKVVRHIHFLNCTFSDIRGYKDWSLGGTALLTSNSEKNSAYFDDLRVENCTFYNCTRNGFSMYLDVPTDAVSQKLNKNVVIRNNTFEKVPGDVILVSGTDGALIEGNTVRFGGQLGVGYTVPGQLDVKRQNYAAAIWVMHAKNSIIRYNISQDSHTMRDGGGFDVDADCENTLIEYNISYNNSGGFLLLCPTRNTPHKNTIVRYNISIDDGQRNFQRQAMTESGLDPYPDASLIQFVQGIESCYIYNNTFVKTKFPVSTDWNDNTAFAFSNNLGVDRPSDIYIANNLLYTTATEKNPFWRTESGSPVKDGVVRFRNNYIHGYSNRAFGAENSEYNRGNVYKDDHEPHPFVGSIGNWGEKMEFEQACQKLKPKPSSHDIIGAGLSMSALENLFGSQTSAFPGSAVDFWGKNIGASHNIGAYNH